MNPEDDHVDERGVTLTMRCTHCRSDYDWHVGEDDGSDECPHCARRDDTVKAPTG